MGLLDRAKAALSGKDTITAAREKFAKEASDYREKLSAAEAKLVSVREALGPADYRVDQEPTQENKAALAKIEIELAETKRTIERLQRLIAANADASAQFERDVVRKAKESIWASAEKVLAERDAAAKAATEHLEAFAKEVKRVIDLSRDSLTVCNDLPHYTVLGRVPIFNLIRSELMRLSVLTGITPMTSMNKEQDSLPGSKLFDLLGDVTKLEPWYTTLANRSQAALAELRNSGRATLPSALITSIAPRTAAEIQIEVDASRKPNDLGPREADPDTMPGKRMTLAEATAAMTPRKRVETIDHRQNKG